MKVINDNIIIRKMTLDDLNSIQNILFTEFDNFWTFSAFKQELNCENSHFIVAKNNNEIVGFAGLKIIVDEADIMNIVVKKTFRHNGIGSILLKNLISYAMDNNLKTITLEVNEHNLSATDLSNEALNNFLDGFKEENRSFVQEKGYKSVDDMVTALKGLSQFEGKDLSNMVSLPTDKSTAEEIAAFYGKLGCPEKPEGYVFGKNDTEFAKSIAPILQESGITQTQLDVLMPKWNEFINAQNQAAEQQLVSDNEKATKDLKNEWGNDYDANIDLAKKATKALGFSADEIDSICKVKGSAWVYKTMAKFGKAFSDDTIKGVGASAQPNLSNPKEALARIERLKHDSNFAARIAKGEEAALKEWEMLHNAAYGGK